MQPLRTPPYFRTATNNIDRIVRGDYINLFATFDFTYPRIKRTLLLGTRWGDSYAKLIPAPGEPWYLNYSYDPLSVGIAPPPAAPTSPNTAQPPPAPEPPTQSSYGAAGWSLMLTRLVRNQLIIFTVLSVVGMAE